MQTKLLALSFTVLGTLSSTASATLVDRGAGLIFDSELNVTWIQNANLGATEHFGVQSHTTNSDGIYLDGRMNWVTALSWIDGMNTSNYRGYNDWRLPKIPLPNAANLNCATYDGSSDCGYNIANKNNEIAFLFYGSLGNISNFDSKGNYRNRPAVSTGPFFNTDQRRYWLGTPLPPVFGPHQAFTFAFDSGLKEWDDKFDPYYATFAWALRNGDVSPVPEPLTAILMIFGLFAITGRLHNL